MQCPYCDKPIGLNMPDEWLDEYLSKVSDTRKHPQTDADALLIHVLIAHLPDAANALAVGDKLQVVEFAAVAQRISDDPDTTPHINALVMNVFERALGNALFRLSKGIMEGTPFSVN